MYPAPTRPMPISAIVGGSGTDCTLRALYVTRIGIAKSLEIPTPGIVPVPVTIPLEAPTEYSKLPNPPKSIDVK